MSAKKALQEKSRYKPAISLTAFILMTSVFSTTSLAGFEWQPAQPFEPQRQVIIKSHTNKTIDMVQPEKEEVKEQPSEPEIQWYQPPEIKEAVKEEPKPAPTPQATPEKKKTLAIVETKEEPKKTVKEVIKEAVSNMDKEPALSPAKSAYKMAQGFGNDVPLALALRQIVPADFGYAVQNNANLGLRVDWSGNKPWDEVLNAAINKYDLEAVVIEKTVLIKKVGAPIEAPKPKTAPTVEKTTEIEQKSEMMREDEKITQKTSSASHKPTSLTKVSQWKAEEGDELYPVMVQWCNAAGVKLLWNAKEKYEISEDVEVNGNFEKAVQKILMTFKGQEQRPVGMFKSNDPKGKAVLSVSDSSNS